MKKSTEILEMVKQAIDSISYEQGPKGLYDPIRYVLSLGGKRLRPVLMLMAYNMYDDDVRQALQQALGLEVYHNFTLLHDDLMDRADVRRGKPCVHKVWNDNTAILSGDNMLVMAYQYMSLSPAHLMPRILDLFTKTALEISNGQQMDVDFETRDDVKESEYIEMIRLKTSVLLACAVKIGALLGGASEEEAQKLYEFGEKLGLAFQLQDDYLDVYGDFKTFGKRIGGDILCNKKTFMLINALNHATAGQRKELDKWLSATECDEEQKISVVTRLFTEIGVDAMARERIGEYFLQAKQCLSNVNLPEERKRLLGEYALQLLGRQS